MNDEDRNIKTLFTGLILIGLVVLVFFFKQNFLKSKNKSLNEVKTSSFDESAYAGIAASELFGMIQKKEPITVFDLRDPTLFSSEHIVDSKNLSVSDFLNKYAEPDNSQVVLVDDIGLTPNIRIVLDKFENGKFGKLLYLKDGFNGWKASLLPTISDGDPYAITDQAKVSYVSCEELVSWISNKDPAFIVDVRNGNDFEKEHLLGAINLELKEFELEHRHQEFPAGKKIIIYDDNGLMAFKGAVRLFDLGIMNVYALEEGLASCKSKGLETVSR